MLSKLESSLDRASEQTSTSADRTVNAILAMTETLVSVFEKSNNKTAFLQDEEVTTKSDNSEEETFDEAVQTDDIIEENLEENHDYYDEQYRIGYEEYMKSNTKFRAKQEKPDFHAKTHQEQNTHQSNHGRNQESSIEYIENVQQKQKQKQQQFQINHQNNYNSEQTTLSGNSSSRTTNPKTNFKSNTNLFDTATSGTVKFKDIQAELPRIKLRDDSNMELEEFYDMFILSISYGYNYDISHLPSAEQLTKNTDIKSYFIQGLEHNDLGLRKMTAMYDRIGRLFRNCLILEECIPVATCPEAANIILHNKKLDGWQLLLVLLKGRLVKLGARPSRDLDAERVAINLKPGETYHTLYEKCNMLSQEYESQSQHIHQCPRIKLLEKFIFELMRSPIYIPYIMDYEMKLITHLEEHGNTDYTVSLPFTMKHVYDLLQRRKIKFVPQELNEASTATFVSQSADASTYNSPSSQPLLANCETQLQQQTEIDDYDDDHIYQLDTPELCAFICNKRNICECCMTGPHPAEKCFLRGPSFQPKELQQRINLYNKQHGSKPPE